MFLSHGDGDMLGVWLLPLTAVLAAAPSATAAGQAAPPPAPPPCFTPLRPCGRNQNQSWCPDGSRELQCGGGPAGPTHVTVHTSTVTHTVSNMTLGCHSDAGFLHQARGFDSQMIFGDSFNASGVGRWNAQKSDASIKFAATQDSAVLFHGVPSQQLEFISGRGTAGLSNRGLANAGMVFEAGKTYEGFLFAAARHAAGPVPLTLTLEDYTAHRIGTGILAETTLQVEGTEFSRYNFTLTPNASTRCVDIAPNSDPAVDCGMNTTGYSLGHTCVRCGGQFALGLDRKSKVLVNYVLLQPGQWGRAAGLPVLRSAVDTLQHMGVTAIRYGGSFASSPSASGDPNYYQWQRWTGPRWARRSRADGVWGDQNLVSGFGPFDMIEMCNQLGIAPVMTTTATSSPTDLAALVEYCLGNVSTPMGSKRAADGRVAPYDVRFFELGNEQNNGGFVSQVAAMEAKARALGAAGTLHYIFPSNAGLNHSEMEAAKALARSGGVDARQILVDIHVGALHPLEAMEQASALFNATPDFEFGAIQAETNAGTHSFARAMSEASSLNAWFSTAGDLSSRLHGRFASFCFGSATDINSQWDQALAFFQPNMTWLQ